MRTMLAHSNQGMMLRTIRFGIHSCVKKPCYGTHNAMLCAARIQMQKSISVLTRTNNYSRYFVKLHRCCYYSLHPFRLFCSSFISRTNHESDSKVSTEDSDLDDFLSWDPQSKEVFQGHYMLPSLGHNVFVIQPVIKSGQDRSRHSTPDLQLDEACALVETLPHWKVCEKVVFTLKRIDHKQVFSKGQFSEITTRIRKMKNVTAVFLSKDILSTSQLTTLQEAWGLPVYDRYTIVLQIFKFRARTKEAKLQVAAAEIPYLRSRLKGMHEGTLDQQKGGMMSVGGSGETFLQTRQRLLQTRELKIKRALSRLQSKRDILRKERTKKQLPVVAVVGYTNAGKTSLIKLLTGKESMTPRHQLFATLDVTAHAGILPNRMKVLFIDTVGFISDIPTALIQSFSATLEDILLADLIIHVRDISHPEKDSQKVVVIATLQKLNLPHKLTENIIEVCNKADLLESTEDYLDSEDNLLISATTGRGVDKLLDRVQTALLKATGRMTKVLKIPMNGQHLSWLYQEAAVKSTKPLDGDTETLLVEVVMTEAAYGKFKVKFGNKKNNAR